MKITVFGANGGIGKLLVKQALDEGFVVNAYIRNPSKFEYKHPNLVLIKGELDDFETIKNSISGVDCVISTLGPPLKRNYEGWAVLDGHKNMIRAMEAENVKRLITIATPSVKFIKDVPSLVTKMPTIMAKLLFPKAYQEIVQVGLVVSASKLDWTIVRFIAPNDKPPTGKVKVTFGESKISWGISRADIASYLFYLIKDKQQVNSMPIIGS
jgi:putative NADH-flavin reductase